MVTFSSHPSRLFPPLNTDLIPFTRSFDRTKTTDNTIKRFTLKAVTKMETTKDLFDWLMVAVLVSSLVAGSVYFAEAVVAITIP